jgi:hypothetical protein
MWSCWFLLLLMANGLIFVYVCHIYSFYCLLALAHAKLRETNMCSVPVFNVLLVFAQMFFLCADIDTYNNHMFNILCFFTHTICIYFYSLFFYSWLLTSLTHRTRFIYIVHILFCILWIGPETVTNMHLNNNYDNHEL